jgi:septum formation protein
MIDESLRYGERGEDYVRRLALDKASSLAMHELSPPILGADTAIVCRDEVFGKPQNFEQFKEMLEALSGSKHVVLSAVAINNGKSSSVLVCKTSVSFRVITNQEINYYWRTGEPRDKAGGYAIQGKGAIFIKHISGSYSGVVGLPIFETSQLMKNFNIPFMGLKTEIYND